MNKKTRYAHYNINYHFVWIPKYRRACLDKYKEKLEEVLRTCNPDFEILALEIQPDHVHCFLSAPPRYSPSEIVNVLKGASSHYLGSCFVGWTRTYYVGTAGSVSSETIKRYITECQSGNKDV